VYGQLGEPRVVDDQLRRGRRHDRFQLVECQAVVQRHHEGAEPRHRVPELERLETRFPHVHDPIAALDRELGGEGVGDPIRPAGQL
jgi:hypothetical protein